MPSDGSLNPESEDFPQFRPAFWIGQHDSARVDALTDGHYDQILNSGVTSSPCLPPPPRISGTI